MLRRTLLILAVSALLLAAVSCAGDGYDAGDSADIVLQVQNMTVPPINAQLDPLTLTCTFTVTESIATLESVPKSQGEVFSPANDALITSMTITYQWDDGFNMAPYITSPRVVVPAGGTGQIRFIAAPLTQLLGTGRDGHSADMTIVFNGTTEAGENVQAVGGAALIVNSCQ